MYKSIYLFVYMYYISFNWNSNGQVRAMSQTNHEDFTSSRSDRDLCRTLIPRMKSYQSRERDPMHPTK